MRDFGSAAAGSALPDAVAGWLACTGALPFLGAAVFGGAIVAGKKKEELGGNELWEEGGV